MTTAMHDLRSEEGRQSQEYFDRVVIPKLPPEDMNKYVAVDMDTGEYEVDEDDYQASMRLLARLPQARAYLFRAGWPATYCMGGGQHRAGAK
ncbi:MAG: hypothetical protein K2W96_12025 [Gemmataceae bacterium]|nr:hypothetical protein [Gemmataceae bacterium]